MASAVVVAQSRAIPIGVEKAFRGTLPIPLPMIFRRWYGPIPPIKEVVDQTGEWSTPGQARVVKLVGGGSMREELTSIDPPKSFGYTLTELKGPLAPLVRQIEGEWTFAPAGDGTTVTWQWTIHPRSPLAAPLLPVFARIWKGYARQSLAELAARLLG